MNKHHSHVDAQGKACFLKRVNMAGLVMTTLLILFGFLTVYNIYRYFAVNEELERDAKENIVKKKTQAAITRLDEEFKELEAIAGKLSEELGSLRIKKDTKQIDKELYKLSQVRLGNKNHYANAIGIAYLPDNGRLFSRMYRKKDNSIKNMKDDYPDRDFFKLPMKEGTGIWIEPHLGRDSEEIVAAYCVPFYKYNPANNKKEKAGVVFINYSYFDIKEIMQEFSLGNTGYGFILSPQKVFIAHPLDEYVQNLKSVEDIYDNPGLKSAIKKAIDENIKEVLSFTNKGSAAWLLCGKIPSTSWRVGAVFLKDEIINITILRHSLIILLSSLLLFFSTLTLTGFKVYKPKARNLWGASIVLSIILIAGIGVLWYLSYNNQEHDMQGIKEVDKAQEVEDISLDAINQNEITKVPTGLTVQSLEFSGINEVMITGFIWHASFKEKGKSSNNNGSEDCKIFFLNSISSEFEFYANKNDTLFWSFKCILKQRFDYSKYPLDSKELSLVMGYKEEAVMLTPDMNSYVYKNPLSLPGISSDIVLSEMIPKKSYFNYIRYSDFSMQGARENSTIPLLNFTFIIQRSFLSPFITNLMPLFVILCILFASISMATRKEIAKDSHIQRAAQLMTSTGALAVSAIIAHSQIRAGIPVKNIIYLDYFFFILYMSILLAAFDAYLFGFKHRSKWIVYGDNIISKIIFWPITLTLIFITTLLTLY